MQVVAVRQQAQAPVVARDFANMSEVDAKIVEIREAFQSIETHVPIARNAFFWRMFSYFASGPEAADVLLLNIQNVFNALPGLYEGVCKHAPRNELAGKMALVNDFELKAIRWEKDIHVLTSMRNASFIRMFVICQQHATALKNLLEIPDVEEQLKQLQVIVKACETTVLEHQLKEEAIELFNMVQVAASALKEKIDDRVEMTEGHKETINQFLITNKKRIEELPLKSCFERDLGNPEAISDETRAAIDGIKGSEQEFEVWKEYSLLSIAYSSVRGSCQQTKAHGNLMQEDIGKRIVGLLSDIKERLTLLSEHELTDIQAITVRRELNEYHQYILTIQQKLEEKGNQVWKLPQDERHETLRNYVHGLNLSLVRAMDILLLCRDFLKKQALNVTRIYVLMQRYLTRAVSPIADVASFEDTAAVFSVGLQIRAVKQIAMVEVCDDPQIESYITRTQQIVESLFVRTATESCTLREEEKLVFDVVMQGESLDGLYYKKESKTLLPKRVQAVLIKRATAALLLAKDAPLVSADGPVDSELELLFHILHTTQLYAQTLKNVPDFAAVMEEYTSWHQTYRRDDFLHRAYGVLCSINQALTEKPDVFVFAKLIQAYVDFSRDPVSFAAEGKAAEAVKKRHKSLTEFLFTQLQKLAVAKAYPQLAELESLAQNNRFAMTLEEAKKVLFDAAVFRLVSACLYEKQVSDKVTAQKELNHLIELPCYKEDRLGISEYTKQLLYENTTNRLLSGDLLVDKNGSNELTMYIAGPIEELLANELNSVERNNVRHAIWQIVLQEGVLPEHKQTVTTRLKAVLKGEAAFADWCKTYRDFMISSIKDKAYLEQLATGDERAMRILEIKYGKHEVVNVRETAKQVLAYTKTLSALKQVAE